MPEGRTPPGFWLQLHQALVAREAVEQMGLSGRRVAALLGLTPSAVSQYLSGKRLGPRFLEYATNEEARRLARETIDRLRAEEAGSVEGTSVVLDGAAKLAQLIQDPRRASGPARPSGAPGRSFPIHSRAMSKWLRHRIRSEQAAVSQSMRLAQKARDELTRAILRQIASDSLRHAEIVASLATYLDRGVAASYASGITPKEVRALIENERRAEAQADIQLAQHLHGTLALLVASMEADERKHTELLQGLLASGFRARAGSDPGAPGSRAR